MQTVRDLNERSCCSDVRGPRIRTAERLQFGETLLVQPGLHLRLLGTHGAL